MLLCSGLRDKTSRGILVYPIISEIQNERKKKEKIKNTVYIIDQLKNVGEYEILKHTYGKNYIQLSLYLNASERDEFLAKKLNEDKDSHSLIHKKDDLIQSIYEKTFVGSRPVKNYFTQEEIKKLG